jgi:hypothetical protein
MPQEPSIKRVHAFIDGQNLFYAAKDAFGYTYPNYDPLKLAQAICHAQGWQLAACRFYTGLPAASRAFASAHLSTSNFTTCPPFRP